MSIANTGTLPGFPEDERVRTAKNNEGPAAGIGHNSQQKRPKSAKERAKSHYQRKTESGWKKTWVDPRTLALAEQLGGIDEIASDRAQLLKKIEEQAEELDAQRSRGLWSRILNRK